MIRQLHVNGLTFPVLSWGPEGGRPLLLLHGFPQEPSTWTRLAECLAAQGLHAYAPWQRGYGATTRPVKREDYNFERFVADALGIADALGLEWFDVVGFGMGGTQAWMLAARHPGRVRSLTSLRYPHPAAFARGIQCEPQQRQKWADLQQQLGSANLEERVAGLLADGGKRLREFLIGVGLPQPFLNQYVERLKQPGALIGALAWERSIDLDEFARVPAVTTPTLLIWSEGPALAPTTVEATRGYVVNAPFRETLLPDVGNFILESCPARLLAPLCNHLRAT
jgi:pimeloyl-ACP methyl ester carboxylesterase